MGKESAKQPESPKKKSESSAKPVVSERKRLEKAIGDFLQKASQYKEPLEDALYAWITTHPQGKSLLDKLTLHKTESLRKLVEKPQDIILLLHNDGWLEVYGQKTNSVVAYTMPWCDVPGDLAQDMVEVTMPERLARAMWPNGLKDKPGLITHFQVTKVTVPRGIKEESLYTWKICQNPWNVSALAKVTSGSATEAKSP